LTASIVAKCLKIISDTTHIAPVSGVYAELLKGGLFTLHPKTHPLLLLYCSL